MLERGGWGLAPFTYKAQARAGTGLKRDGMVSGLYRGEGRSDTVMWMWQRTACPLFEDSVGPSDLSPSFLSHRGGLVVVILAKHVVADLSVSVSGDK